mgnify:CR=1 FL=1
MAFDHHFAAMGLMTSLLNYTPESALFLRSKIFSLKSDPSKGKHSEKGKQVRILAAFLMLQQEIYQQ